MIGLNNRQQEKCSQLAAGHEGSWAGQHWAASSYVLHRLPAVPSCMRRGRALHVWIQQG